MRQRRLHPVTTPIPARARARPLERPAPWRYAVPLAVATALALLLAAGTARADVFRWVDATGGVHYSDVPVEGAVLIRSTVSARQFEASLASARAASAPAAPNAGAAVSNRLADEATQRQIQKDVDKKRSEQCKAATERYEKSVAARRIYREGKNGEREYLSEAELGTARLEAKKMLDESCGAAAR
jgi:hypothetical protein